MKNKITKHQFEDILEEIIDIEEIDNYKILIITNKNRIVLNNVTSNIKDLCYEKLSNRINPYTKSYNYKKVHWKTEEINFLKSNFNLKTLDELEIILNKSKFQINFMMSKLNLFVKKRWDRDEIEFLKKNITQSTIWLATKLHRPLGSIKTQKRKLLSSISSQN